MAVMFYTFWFGDGKLNRPYNIGSTNIVAFQKASEIVQLPRLVSERKRGAQGK